MHISKRLKTIASFIDYNDKTIYDVGCDHALLDIYLAGKYKEIDFFAIDISNKCIEKANENIEKYNLKNRVATQVNNGLNELILKEESTLIISGMGAHTIINILNNCDITKFKKIIIQSNTDLEVLRRNLVKKGFIIQMEESIYDKRFYVVIMFVPGRQEYNSIEYLLGPKLLINAEKNKDYFLFLYQKNKEIYTRLPLFNIKKRLYILWLMRKIKKLLKK